MNTILQSYPDILTISQLQEILQIGRNKAYDLLKNGSIKYVDLGKKYRIPKICIIEYLKTHVV